MSSIPFVIDNQQFRMSEVLNTLLTQYKGQSLDIATAYFNVGGWQLLAEGISGMDSFRLLLGDEPEAGADLGLLEVDVTTLSRWENGKAHPRDCRQNISWKPPPEN